ncbi:type II secretion system protein [Methylovirgula ligni]|uniref:Tight adherence protein C n=1 Tax=Methylovirgula ligni TaxID=569860 RepID=A0A3D9Z2Q9_9HYPH|nr:type II secretion system F family protein [Methylovirgula ligni]QAY94528.1 type II secretion system protein [Methylovirgula ligni]REF87609.1 tight adherence protein C [Methylovirgula ligni]
MNDVTDFLLNRQAMLAALVAISIFATILTFAMPLLQTDRLGRRMKIVASERERIRARERERLAESKVTLRQAPKAYMKNIVDRFNLSSWLGTEKAKHQMVMAGFRGQQAEVGFLFFRLVTPIGVFVFALIYLFFLSRFGLSPMMNIAVAIGAAYIGIKAPEIYVSNAIAKRQKSMSKAVPDSLDLMLICVESGMSIELAFRKVAQEVGIQSIPLAEELTLTTAELSYLSDRRQAFENLGTRTGVDSLKQISTVLTQAERYGTPLAQALRIVATESRQRRMSEAEKKAAALPPKLTVPMILFFLPVLFAVIITPAIIQVSATMR